MVLLRAKMLLGRYQLRSHDERSDDQGMSMVAQDLELIRDYGSTKEFFRNQKASGRGCLALFKKRRSFPSRTHSDSQQSPCILRCEATKYCVSLVCGVKRIHLCGSTAPSLTSLPERCACLYHPPTQGHLHSPPPSEEKKSAAPLSPCTLDIFFPTAFICQGEYAAAHTRGLPRNATPLSHF